MNKSDSERIAGYLEKNGFKRTDYRGQADLIVVNTCGVRQSAEDRIYGIIPAIKKRNPKVKIILAGCLSERKDVQKRLAGKVDIWLPIKQISDIGYLISDQTQVTDKVSENCNYLGIKPKYNSKFSAFVPIGNGCNNFCSYCVVPYARGREVYRSVRQILNEIKKLTKKGYKEIILIAQNVNSYQYDTNDKAIGFADLLRLVNDIDGEFWVRFLTSHPKDMSDELIKTIAECDKVCEHIHLPVQAGDNKVLKSMNRKYTVGHYKKLIKKIRQAIPGAAITTDVIVGFPGETKAQFNNTVKLFKEMKFDMAYISKYSSRPGTSAEKLEDDVKKIEKKSREEELMKILSQTALENSKRYINKIVKVLIKGKSRKGEWYGETKTGKIVKVKSNKNLAGEFVNVKINKTRNFGLEGKVV